MGYHEWGKEDFDWEGLYKAEMFIKEYVYKRSLCYLVSKEKYGTIRYEFVFAPCLNNFRLYIPGIYRISPWGKVYKYQWIWTHSRLYNLWCSLGWRMLKKAIFKAIEKWPHLRDEILQDAPEELIGSKLYNKYWKKIDKVEIDEY